MGERGPTAQDQAGEKARKPDSRLERRLQQIDKLGAKEKRQVMKLLDTFIGNARLKQQAGG